MDQERPIITLRNQKPGAASRHPSGQTLDIADWLSRSFRPASRFPDVRIQYAGAATGSGNSRKWLNPGDANVLAQAVDNLRTLTPEVAAVCSTRMRPSARCTAPGSGGAGDRWPSDARQERGQGITSRPRNARAVRRGAPQFAAEVPIDVILLPMQGDLPAPHRFWTMAVRPVAHS